MHHRLKQHKHLAQMRFAVAQQMLIASMLGQGAGMTGQQVQYLQSVGCGGVRYPIVGGEYPQKLALFAEEGDGVHRAHPARRWISSATPHVP